jgi:hypothetical protein
MNDRLMFRPNLNDCILEDRALMATNLGIIVLTTSGLTLLTPFPGANSSGAGSLGSNGGGGGSASSVSGLPIPTSFYITGSGGFSSFRPGNITGLSSLAASSSSQSATVLSLSIQVGSGADTPGGPTVSFNPVGATNVVVSRATVADPLTPSQFTFIGGPSTSTNSPVLPPGQTYRDSAPVPPPAPMGIVNQPATGTGSMNSGGLPGGLNPQLGAPRLGPFNSVRGMNSAMPGSLVPVTPLLPGNN